MQPKINILKSLAIASACLALPVLYIYQTAGLINPYHLNGKQFLAFFIILSGTSFITAICWHLSLSNQSADTGIHQHQKVPQPQYCILLVLLIGVARLVQGISNAKPVGFLVMMLLANLIFLFIITGIKKKN